MTPPPTTPFWLTAFLDFAPSSFAESVDFWSRVTGYAVSPVRGERDEFASLVPPDGDELLRVQRLDAGRSRIHLDLHVADPHAAATRAIALGAGEIADHGYVVLSSPGGMVFCFVAHPASSAPPAVAWPGGHRSRPHHVCLDVPGPRWSAELAFWSALVGAEPDPIAHRPEFTWLRPHPRPWSALLMQRRDDAEGPTRAHLDIATDDRPAEEERHRGHGARVVHRERWWTVLTDPAGLRYCLVDKAPDQEQGP